MIYVNLLPVWATFYSFFIWNRSTYTTDTFTESPNIDELGIYKFAHWCHIILINWSKHRLTVRLIDTNERCVNGNTTTLFSQIKQRSKQTKIESLFWIFIRNFAWTKLIIIRQTLKKEWRYRKYLVEENQCIVG